MKGSRVALRYAKSILDLAIERSELEQVYKEVMLVYNTCNSSREFTNFLKSPIIKADKKLTVITEIFSGKISKLFMSFLAIIVQKRREEYLTAILFSFNDQYKVHKGIKTSVISTVSSLDSSLRDELKNRIMKSTKSEVALEERIDKDLIGGFTLRIGDLQIDTSIRRKLRNLRKDFKDNPYIADF